MARRQRARGVRGRCGGRLALAAQHPLSLEWSATKPKSTTEAFGATLPRVVLTPWGQLRGQALGALAAALAQRGVPCLIWDRRGCGSAWELSEQPLPEQEAGDT